MKNMALAIASVIGLGLVSVTAIEAEAQNRPAARAPAAADIPAELKKKAIATRSDRTGQIAGAEINKSGYYLVYMKTNRGCGTGGCRAQLWKKQGNSFAQVDTLTVGFLPIIQIPKGSGMPDLGITVQEQGKDSILKMSFNGSTYVESGALANAKGSSPLLTQGMLKAF